MNEIGKNLGFLCKNRWLDLAVTGACVAVTAQAIVAGIDELMAYAVPAGIGIIRQFMPLLTFPFVASIGIALLMTLSWADWLPFTMFSWAN